MECKGQSGNRVPSTSIMVPAAHWQIRLSTSSPRCHKARKRQALAQAPLSPENNVEDHRGGRRRSAATDWSAGLSYVHGLLVASGKAAWLGLLGGLSVVRVGPSEDLALLRFQPRVRDVLLCVGGRRLRRCGLLHSSHSGPQVSSRWGFETP